MWYSQLKTNQDNALLVCDDCNGLAIASGEVTGKSSQSKFGNAPDFDTTDGELTVWDGANDSSINQMDYQYSSTADIDSLVSSDNGDTVDITIIGLDASYNEVTQTITLTGQTRAALTTDLIRVYRMINVGAADLSGYVSCYVDSAITGGVVDDSTKVRALINNGNNQSEMAVYTVPNGKTAYMRYWYGSSAGANKTTAYILKLKVRPQGQVFQLKHRASISETSPYQHYYSEPLAFAAKTDIEMTVQAAEVGVTEASFSAGFDLVLVDD